MKLFLIASGFRNTSGKYWSSTPSVGYPYGSYGFYFYSGNIVPYDYDLHYYGFSIRNINIR